MAMLLPTNNSLWLNDFVTEKNIQVQLNELKPQSCQLSIPFFFPA